MYGANITYFEKMETGAIYPHSTQIIGSRSRILNEISEVIKNHSEDMHNLTVIIEPVEEKK